MNQACSLIGKTVVVQDDDENTITGSVTKVVIEDSVPKIVINGTNYTISQVQEIK